MPGNCSSTATPRLRTTLHWRDLERPLQAVHRRATVSVRASDLARLDAPARRRAVRRFLLDDRTRGFDLSRAPLVRVTVLRTTPDEHYVVVTLHHIVLDGWSLSIVMDEFARLYAAGEGSAGVDLGPVPPYSRFIAWLREGSPARVGGVLAGRAGRLHRSTVAGRLDRRRSRQASCAARYLPTSIAGCAPSLAAPARR